MLFNPWLVFSLVFLGVWFVVWMVRPALRKEMLWASVITAPIALSEPLFVPEYWNPPSLFNLAARTGFDIESFIFSFAIGGLGSVLYEAILNEHHQQLKNVRDHWFHSLSILLPLPTFLLLELLTTWNAIYTTSAAMALGGLATMLCRRDLVKHTIVGGLIFLVFYGSIFLLFTFLYPGIVTQVWNLPALSGTLILGIPLEELFFAGSFGMLWSSVYEHIMGIRART